MLRTRLIVGTAMAALTAGMLLFDERFPPWYPFLFVTVVLLAVLGVTELVHLLPINRRPIPGICLAGVLGVIVLNWAPTALVRGETLNASFGLYWAASGMAAVVLAAFLVEMARFSGTGGAVERIALTVWAVAYLGLLPCFLVQVRMEAANARLGTVALALAIFVPKGCDIGAYFTGRIIGRHRMTPVLSPKKTWEGAAGGLQPPSGHFLLDAFGPVVPGGATGIVAFGLGVGTAGMLGDLAESLIKRDVQQKDASQMVPGFGGILDVVDAILFAAPVVYWWLR